MRRLAIRRTDLRHGQAEEVDRAFQQSPLTDEATDAPRNPCQSL
jgi:hypothetical protein